MQKEITGLCLGFWIVAAMLLASCATTTSTTTSTPLTTEAGPILITVVNGSTIKTYSMTDLQDNFTAVTGYGGQKGTDNTITGPYPYQGVALTDLLNAVGGIAEGQSVTITGANTYGNSYFSKTLTYDQITNDSFNFYDTSGNPVTPTTKPVLTVIYWANGVLLVNGGGPMGISGPTELGIISTQNLVSDNSLWIGSLTEIDIIPTP